MKTKLPGSREELVEASLKGAISAIPVVGGLIAELGGHLANPLDERRRAWVAEVELALDELAKSFDRLPDSLADDPKFVTALIKATAIALESHREEKLRVLRNFIVAIGSKAIQDDELQSALMLLIENLTVGHIEVLRFLDKNYGEIRHKEDLEAIFGIYYYRFSGQLDRMAFRWILADLATRVVIHLGDIADLNEYKSNEALPQTDEHVIA